MSGRRDADGKVSTTGHEHGKGAGETVADRLRSAQRVLSPAERKIARALMARYPAAGLETTHGLAARAGVSAPTVVRFVSRLGFSGYGEFQQALRDEVQARRASPLTLAPVITDASHTGELSEAAAEVGRVALHQTFAALPEKDFEQAAALLSDPTLRITGFGGRFTHPLVQYFMLHLRLMRPGVEMYAQPPHRDAGFLVDVGPQYVCVVFDLRRYQRDTVELARLAHERGARIVLFTDPWLSPIAEFADVVLTARVEAPGSWDSIVAHTALVEALVAAVHARLGPAADRRMREADEAAEGLTTD
ncbi:MurR/RpiR family transcriptional regulator [Streptomyces sp. NPDC014983]|uniref:MurR/RpiR family transcriptional regulator n=1 Tax=Streptomyces sp. NPDC014983 TaxID=3364933 RepID=UPI0036FB5B35